MAASSKHRYTLETTVAAALAMHPRAPAVFRQLGMAACLGCAMAPFETLAEAADEYGLDVDVLLSALRASSKD